MSVRKDYGPKGCAEFALLPALIAVVLAKLAPKRKRKKS